MEAKRKLQVTALIVLRDTFFLIVWWRKIEREQYRKVFGKRDKNCLGEESKDCYHESVRSDVRRVHETVVDYWGVPRSLGTHGMSWRNSGMRQSVGVERGCL